MAAEQHIGPVLLRMGPVVILVGVCFQLLRLWTRSRRSRVYAHLCRDLPLHACHPDHGVSLPELKAVTQHVQGEIEDYEVHIFENVSDLVEPGMPTETQTAVVLAKPDWKLPVFTIEPRSMATNLRQHVDKNKGMFFPKDEQFTTSCFVDAPDHAAVQSLLVPAATQYLRGNKHVHVESRGNVLLVYRSEELLSAKRTKELLEQAIGFADGLAGHV